MGGFVKQLLHSCIEVTLSHFGLTLSYLGLPSLQTTVVFMNTAMSVNCSHDEGFSVTILI